MFYLGNRCLCNGSVSYPPKKKDCEFCIQAASVYIPCHEMPTAGETGVIPLSEYNNYDICEGDFELIIYSSDDNVTATIDVNNDLEFTVDDLYVPDGSSLKVTYKVICGSKGMSSYGFITLCQPTN